MDAQPNITSLVHDGCLTEPHLFMTDAQQNLTSTGSKDTAELSFQGPTSSWLRARQVDLAWTCDDNVTLENNVTHGHPVTWANTDWDTSWHVIVDTWWVMTYSRGHIAGTRHWNKYAVTSILSMSHNYIHWISHMSSQQQMKWWHDWMSRPRSFAFKLNWITEVIKS